MWCVTGVHDLDVIHWLFDHDTKVRLRACAGKSHSSVGFGQMKQNMNVIDVQILSKMLSEVHSACN